MGYTPQLITPFVDSGLKKFFKPFIIGPTAFPSINNAYSWRGSVRKREGYRLFGTLPLGDAPVQGIKSWINPSTLNPNLIVFSLTKSYGFNTGTLTFVNITQFNDTATAFTFGNTGTDYFWTSNFAGSMWTTNGLPFTGVRPTVGVNGIFYLTNNGINSWNIYQPLLNTVYLNGALIIIPYKGRLVVLNTTEGAQNGSSPANFSNRARWSQLGTPYVGTGGGYTTQTPPPFGVDANAWRDDIPGKGGFIDADTSERIVSAAIVKDTLIVGFQRSTWRLRYTGNEILPFIWERLNTQYGAEATYSAISFDDSALFFSRFGWIGSTTNDVARIDEDIPDDSFSYEGGNSTFQNLKTMQGIRDFYRQYAYWTFSPIGAILPNSQIYAYSYIDKTWSIFNPSVPINCFGEFYNTSDFTWSSFTAVDDIWLNFNSPDDTWQNFGSSQNLSFPFILGGDFSGNIYQMFEFDQSPTTDNGTLFNFNIATKRFNPYLEMGKNCRLGYVDLYLTTNTGGEITVSHFINDQSSPVFQRTLALYPRGVTTIFSIVTGLITTINTTTFHNLVSNQNVIFSNIYGSAANNMNNQTVPVTVVTPTQFTVPIDTFGLAVTSPGYYWNPIFNPGDTTYTRIFLGAIAHMHQLVFNLSNAQLTDPAKGKAQFELQGMVIWTRECAMIRG